MKRQNKWSLCKSSLRWADGAVLFLRKWVHSVWHQSLPPDPIFERSQHFIFIYQHKLHWQPVTSSNLPGLVQPSIQGFNKEKEKICSSYSERDKYNLPQALGQPAGNELHHTLKKHPTPSLINTFNVTITEDNYWQCSVFTSARLNL